MMTLRQRVWIIASIIVGLVAVIILATLLISRNRDNSDNTGTTTPADTATEITPAISGQDQDLSRIVPRTAPTPVFSSEAQPDRLARQIAGIFVERFQSYSTTNDESNIERVENLVTTRMWQWVQTQAPQQEEEYAGVTTEVIASRIQAISASSATVDVDTQQRISEDGAMRIQQRSGRVELVSDGNSGWIVDGFFWNQ